MDFNRAGMAVLTGAALVLGAGRLEAQQPTVITLDDAIEIALERSGEVARADNNVAIGAIGVSEARYGFVPNLSLSASSSQNYGRTFSTEEGGLINESTNTTNLRLSSGVTLFDGFGNVADLRAARYTARAAELDASRTRETVVFSVLSGYLALVEAQEQLRVAEENLAAQREREAQIQTFVNAGSRPISELYQQQATVAAANATVVSARQTVEQAELDLVQEMRLDPRDEYQFVTPALDAEIDAVPLDAAALVTTALEQRSDLIALDQRASAADQAVRAALASRYPTLSLSAGYGSNFATVTDLPLLDQLDDRRSGSLSLGISIPIFDRNTTSRAIERARLQASNADLLVDEQRQQVAIEVQRAILSRASAEASLEAATARVAAAQQALDATEQRYAVGVATLFEVTESRAELVDATSAEVRARYSLLFQDAVLDYYTGTLDIQS